MMWDLRDSHGRAKPSAQWPSQQPRSLTPAISMPIPAQSHSSYGRGHSDFLDIPTNEFRSHSAPGGYQMPSPRPSVASLPIAPMPVMPTPFDQPRGYHPQYIQVSSSHHHLEKKKKHHKHHSQGAMVVQIPAHQVQPIQIYPQPSSSHHRHSHSASNIQPVQYNQITVPPAKIHAQFSYSTCKGRKKALCIGINYTGTQWALKGCVNDAKHVQKALIDYFGYKKEDIVLLTDDASNPRQIPTKKNILDAFQWLVAGAHQNDSLFLHYSGHGGQTKDTDGDEIDGYDEVIYPLDYKKYGHIVDDLMHSMLVKPLPRGCRLTALFDSCHSGTVLDLPYIYSSSGRSKGSQVSNRARARKATSADVISWSGCKDSQTSADTFAGGVAVGAMSWAFISVLKRNPKQSYQQLLANIREVLFAKYTQKPQLGSSHHIDTSLQFVI